MKIYKIANACLKAAPDTPGGYQGSGMAFARMAGGEVVELIYDTADQLTRRDINGTVYGEVRDNDFITHAM